MRNILLCIVFSLFSAYPFDAEQAMDTTFIPENVSFVRLSHRFGTAAVTTNEEGQLHAHLHIIVTANSEDDAEALAGDIALKTQKKGDTLLFSAVHPDEGIPLPEGLSYTIDFSLSVPHTLPVIIESSFGDIDVENVTDCSVMSHHGDVELRNIGAALTVSNSFGSTSVDGASGRVRITSSHGQVEAHRLSGDLKIRNYFGSIAAQEISGKVLIRNTSGDIYIMPSRFSSDAIIVANTFGDITLVLKGDASYKIWAKANGGSFHSDLRVNDMETTPLYQSGFCTIGAGEGEIDLSTKYADIYITHE